MNTKPKLSIYEYFINKLSFKTSTFELYDNAYNLLYELKIRADHNDVDAKQHIYDLRHALNKAVDQFEAK